MMFVEWNRIAFCSLSCRSLNRKHLLTILASTAFVLIIMYVQLNFMFLPPTLDNSFSKDNTVEKATISLKKYDYDFPLVQVLPLKKGEKKSPNEQARYVGLPRVQTENNYSDSIKMIYLATKYFGEVNVNHYYSLHLGFETFRRYSCPQSLCQVTNDPRKLAEADALIFHARDIRISKIPVYRRSEQLYILYSMEPPWLETLNFQRFDAFFNWTMSYRRGSDIMMKYGFVGRRPRKVNSLSRTPSSERFQRKENMAVWYVSNCCTDGNRERFVTELMLHYPVQIFGGCNIVGCRPAETKKCYQKVARKYKFYLAFENALCQDYVTEKLFNILEYEILPVVFGGVDYDTITPPNSVINVKDFDGPKALAEYLWLVSNNYILYSSFFEWKKSYRSYLHPWMCDLCQKLHNFDGKISFKSKDLAKWWNENGSCQRWTGDTFEPVNGTVFPCQDTKIFRQNNSVW